MGWMRLRGCGVGDVSRLGRDEREEGAEDEGDWVYAQKRGLQFRW